MKNTLIILLAIMLASCSNSDGNGNQNDTVVIVESDVNINKESFHIPVGDIPPNPDSGFTNVYNKGGMSIGYIDIAEPMDLSFLFKGLPHDLCNSPHWGYVIDGSLRVIYQDEKQDTVKAGEVFYWPELHTGVVDDSVKFVDFSPDEEFITLMKHIGKVMEESAQENDELK